MECPSCRTGNPDDSHFCRMCGNPLEGFSEIPPAHTLPRDGSHRGLAPGTTFADRYEILGELGRGGMGVIYKAEDTKLKRNVALKFLPWELTRDRAAKDRFVHEARAASTIEHPNICTIHEIDETAEGQMYISMSCYDGETLKARIEREPLNLEEAVDIGVQVAQGLREAHEKGIVHRDIKPSNIMITSKGQAKIMDFGLAKLASGTRLTKAGTAMGTIAYMSPEQAYGEDVDERTDLWSLGVVLYEMVTGEPPFKGEYDQAVIYSILNEAPKPISDSGIKIPGEYERIVRKSMAKDRTERYQSAAELELDLRHFRKESGLEELTAVTKSMAGRYQASRKRWPLVASVAIIALALIILALVPQSRRAFMDLISPGLAEADMRIAVLPCNLSGGGAEDTAFCDGLARLVTGKLRKVETRRQTFQVIPPEDVQRFMKQADTPSAVDVWRKLHANVVITGVLSRTGGVIRLTPMRNDIVVEVRDGIDSPTAIQEQGPQISDPIANLSTWQDDIVVMITDLLELELDPEEWSELSDENTTAPSAYEYYVQGLGYRAPYGKETVPNLDAAISAFERAIEHDPSYARAHVDLARTYMDKYRDTGDTLWAHRAIESSSRALQIDYRMGVAFIERGVAHNGIGDKDLAIQDVKRATEAEPGDYYTYYMVGRTYWKQAQYDSAVRWLQRAIELNARAYDAHYELAWIYYQKTEYEEVVEHCLKAREIKPYAIAPLNYLGAAYTELERLAEARETFEMLIAEDPEPRLASHARSNLGTLYFWGHRYADAVAMYKRALEMAEKDYAIWGQLAEACYWSPGEREEAEANFVRAIQLGEEALKNDPNNPTIVANLAGYYAKTNNPSQARLLLEQAVALEPSGRDNLLHVAETYEELGETEKAFDWIERALKAGASPARIEGYPGLGTLRARPRYKGLIEEYTEGLAED